MKLAILILVAILLLGGAGGAGWWFVLGPGAEVAEAKEEPLPTPGHLALDPIVMPIIQEGQVTEHVTLQVTIEYANAADEVAIAEHQLTLINAYFKELHGLFNLRYIRDQGYTSHIVHDRILERTRELVAPIEVKEIMLRVLEAKDKTGA